METNGNNLEFDVLGTKVRLKPDNNDKQFSANKIVEHVCQEANNIKETFPHLENQKIVTLVALKIAEDFLKMGNEYQININKLQSTAKDALYELDELKAIKN